MVLLSECQQQRCVGTHNSSAMPYRVEGVWGWMGEVWAKTMLLSLNGFIQPCGATV